MQDWIYGLLLIASAIIGALTGIFGQSLKEWWTRPKMKMDLCVIHRKYRKKPDGYILGLIITNCGKTSSSDTELFIEECNLDSEEMGKFPPANVPLKSVHPQDSIIHLFGYASSTDGISIDYMYGEKTKFDDNIKLKITLCSRNTKSVTNVFELNGPTISKLKRLPEDGLLLKSDHLLCY